MPSHSSPATSGGGAASNPMTDVDEFELVQQARDGDVSAFETLLDRYQERVHRIVLPIVKNPMDVEEVVQDVFLSVFRKIDRFRGESSISTWIHRIAVNAALMRRRRHKPGVAVPLEDVLPGFEENGHIAADVADWSMEVADPALQEEARTIIAAAVDRLDDKYLAVFMLRDVEGFSTEETAGILELGLSAVKSRLHRARLYLRRELAEYFDRRTHPERDGNV
jgi:RNA polymerase sigma-70 factor (ECF subfamily)